MDRRLLAFLLMGPLASAQITDGRIGAISPPSTANLSPQELARMGTLTGMVLGKDNQPVPDAVILVRSLGTPPSAQRISSDKDGKFKTTPAPPGDYVVQVVAQGYLRQMYGAEPGSSLSSRPVAVGAGQTVSITIKLARGSTLSGKIVDEDGDGMARILVEVMRTGYYQGQRVLISAASSPSGDDGSFEIGNVPPGNYYVRASVRPTWTADERAPVPVVKPGERDIRYWHTFYPGSSELAGASPVEIGTEQAVSLGTIEMKKIVRVHVYGKVLGNATELAGARVLRLPLEPTTPLGWSYGADIQPDGSFDLANMWSGAFTLSVNKQNGGNMGWTPVQVGEDDLKGVVLNAHADPLRVVITTEGEKPAAANVAAPGSARAGAGAEVAPIGIALVSAEGPSVIGIPARPNVDGYQFQAVPPGKYILDVTRLPAGQYLKSAHLQGRDVLEQVEWAGGSEATLELVLSNKGATLEGTVQDERGAAAPQSMVTLVPDPPRPGRSRIYPTATADNTGRFQVQGVTPGRYRVYAWQEIENTAQWDPNFIRAFESSGERVNLEEGGSASVTVKRITAAAMAEGMQRAGIR